MRTAIISGDVNQVGNIDFLLIGHKNLLRNRICKETDASFKIMDSESWMFPHQYELLEAPSYKWKKVVAIKFRANGKISENQFVRISSPIATALKQPSIESIGILPPTWRNPRYCALGVIYSLWVIGYAYVSSKGLVRELLYSNPEPTQFKIISQTGTEYFEEVLKDDCQLMWKFVKELCEKPKNKSLFYSYKQYKKMNVTFNVSKISI